MVFGFSARSAKKPNTEEGPVPCCRRQNQALRGPPRKSYQVRSVAVEFTIRLCQPGDQDALNQICLRTGDSGADASHLYRHPELLGQLFAAPYAVLEPDLCFVLTRQDAP